MGYLGNTPGESFISFAKQVFTIVNSQTAYTLSHAITNENDIRLVVNNVIQEPGSGKAYTASGTTLTLSAALVNGTDEMYCVYLGRALQTVNAPDGSISNSQVAPTIITGQTAETSIATDDTILIHDTSASALRKMTRANFVSGIGGVNTPAFRSYYSGSHTIADSTNTELHFNTEVFDVGSCYDTSNGRFTPTTAGKYFLYVKLKVQLGGGIVYVEFRKNGSAVHSNYENISSRPSGDYGFQLSTIQEANGSSDYFLINYYQGSGSGKTLYGGTDSGWMGYKLIE